MARVRTLEDARKDLEDAMLIHAYLEKKAAERIKEHAVWLAHHEEQLRQQAEADRQLKEFDRDLDERIANLVSAIGELIRQGKSPLP
ncbi:MAG: hypothetical protein WBW33_15575 [Bryobacteraceae bacterium]